MLWLKRVVVAVAVVFLFPAGIASADIVFNELLVRRDAFHTDQAIELGNNGTGAVNIGGWILWHAGTYSTLPSGINLSPGSLVIVHFNQDGINNSTDVYFPAVELADVSDLALYAPGTLSNGGFTNPSNIRTFVQWGGAPSNGRQSIAQTAGIWTSGTFLPAPATGHSFELCSGSGASPSNFVDQASPTIGANNSCQVPVQKITWSRVKSIFQ